MILFFKFYEMAFVAIWALNFNYVPKLCFIVVLKIEHPIFTAREESFSGIEFYISPNEVASASTFMLIFKYLHIPI